MTTIKTLLQLYQNKIHSLDAELILAHALKKPREWILAHPEAKIERLKDYKIKRLIKQRERGVPLAYLLGQKKFFGLEFFVNKNVLIPRPETELIVELVLENLKAISYKLKAILIDVGTGSGCIPISIIKTLKHKNIKTFAIDISKSALFIAQKNAKKHNAKIKFLLGDLLKPFLKTYTLTNLHTYKLIITANLPYLTPQQFKNEKSIQREPRLALVAGNKNGLSLYKKLLSQIKLLVTNYQLPVTLFLEIDPSQSKPIKLLIKKYLPRAKVKIHKDLAGRKRVVKISSPFIRGRLGGGKG